MSDETLQDFVEKEFYVEPPKAGSSVDEWKAWMDKDRKQRAVAKRKHTMSFQHEEAPDTMQESTMRKVGGVWRQTVCLGISGEEGDYTLEPSEDAKQEGNVILIDFEKNRNKRGGSKKGKSARRRANRRNRNKK